MSSSENKNQKVVIFDFDGTLADTEGILRDIYNEIAKQKKWQAMNDQQYRRLFTSTIWHAIKWSKLRPWRFLYLVKQSRQQLHTEAGRISLFKGIPELINKLHSEGWKLYVLSYNVGTTINLVLKNREVINKLNVLDQAVFFRKHESINKLIKQKAYVRENVWMIGDEVRDITAARKARVKSIAVTWGLDDKPELEAVRPSEIVEKPADIAKLLLSR